MSKTLSEAKRLHALGFAIIWIHPNSKRPVGEKWTDGPKKSWTELEKSFRPDFNVGVRLGSVSPIGDSYLAVIDIDVKGTEPRFKKEAYLALDKLDVVDERNIVKVESGRGGGSAHLYCLSEKPFKTWDPAESEETVKYFSPSKKPSKREILELGAEEIKKGIRLGKAWQISFYSDGRQVVLPPSVHPDTGKPYSWAQPFKSADELPLINFEELKSDDPAPTKDETKRTTYTEQDEVSDFVIDETLDVRWLPDITENVRKLITDGVWKGKKVDDRSAYLLPAATLLAKAGLDKNSILTILTDPSTYLGECAYDHAGNTKSRTRAAKWLWNYTVKRVMREAEASSAVNAFKDVPVNDVTLEDDESAAQDLELGGLTHWRQKLVRTQKGAIQPTFNNLKLIIENSCETKNLVGRDEFANNDFYLCGTPWRSKCGEPLTDIDVVRIKSFICKNYSVEFADNLIVQALTDIADVNRFHPVREYIRGLKWDGVPRIDTWLMKCAGARGPKDYVHAVSRKVLVAMVKRVFEPGCKFDHVLILEGTQGAGKSTLLSNLAGKWFTDQPLVIGDKDAVLTMQSKWLIELGELSSLNRSEVEQMKAFVVQRTDRIRAPYGRKTEEFPRQSVFIGSTNLDEYLKDETGNRRFWPVKCGDEINFEMVGLIRDQLFAEAYAYYQLKEPLYLETKELNALAKTEQLIRGEVDEWTGVIFDVLNEDMFPRSGFEMSKLSDRLDKFGAHKLDKGDQMRISKILKLLGYTKKQESGGGRRRIWYKLGVEPPRTTSNHLGGSSNNTKNKGFL